MNKPMRPDPTFHASPKLAMEARAGEFCIYDYARARMPRNMMGWR